MNLKFNDTFKRTCATVLAIACFMSSSAFMPIEKLIVYAADEVEFLFYFINNISGDIIETGVDGTPEILEGVTMKVSDNLSEMSSSSTGSFTYNADEPFTLDATGDILNYLKTTPSGALGDATVTPYLGFPSVSEYILTPQIQYSLSRTATYEMPFSYYDRKYTYVESNTNYDTDKEHTFETVNGASQSTKDPVKYTITKGNGSDEIHLKEASNVMTIRFTGTLDKYPIIVAKRYKETISSDAGTTGQTVISTQYVEWGLEPDGWDTETQGIYNAADYWQIDKTTLSGYFVDYDISEVAFDMDDDETSVIGRFTLNNNIKDDSGNLVYPNDYLTLTVNFGDMGLTQSILATGDSTNSLTYFTVNFSYETTANRLSFTVKTRVDAVNDIAAYIQNLSTNGYENYSPSYAQSGSTYLVNNHRPFIFDTGYNLDTGNSIDLDAIEDDFYLKTTHAEYNYNNGFYVQWEWVPNGYNDTLGEVPLWEKYSIYGQFEKIGYKTVDGVDYSGEDYSACFTKTEDGTGGDYTINESNQFVIKSDGDYLFNQTEYDLSLENYLNHEALYYEDVEANEELLNAVVIPSFGVDAEYDDAGEIIGGSWKTGSVNYTTQGAMQVVVNNRTEDTYGNLLATVFIFGDENNYNSNYGTLGHKEYINENYDGRGDTIPIISSTVAKIPIKIVGTGDAPTFYVTEATLATYDAETYTYTKVGRVDKWDPYEQIKMPIYGTTGDEVGQLIDPTATTAGVQYFNMDINNGVDGINTPPATIPVGYEPPIPSAPHTVRGGISFGSGKQKTDRLIITNQTLGSSNASITMKYYETSTSANPIGTYTFDTNGEIWEIPFSADLSAVDQHTYYFEIIALDEGLFKMHFDFYYEDQELPKNEDLFIEIEIGSSLPSSEALLDKMYIHMVQDVADPNNLTAEEQRIAEVLNTLYSDKSASASNNPLYGSYPTDILYNIDFTYNSSGYYYYEAELPYVISDVILTPIYETIAQTGGAYPIEVYDPNRSAYVHRVTGSGYGAGDILPNTDEAYPFALIDYNQASLANSTAKWIDITTLAADNATSQKYYLKLVRQNAETSVVLDDLYVETTDTMGDDITLDLTNASGTVVQFETDPVGVGARYYITLPYYYYANQIPVEITAISNADWAKSPTITSDEGLSTATSWLASISNAISNKTTEKFVLDYQNSYGSGTNATGAAYPNKFTIRTYSESDDSYSEYYLTIFIQAPDTNDKLSNLQVLDPTEDDEVLPFKNGTFFSTKNDYIIEIPYELQKYRFSMLPDSDNALAVRLVAPDGTILGSTSYASAGTPIQFLIDFNELGFSNTDLDFTFTIAVQSEDEVWSDQYNHPEGHSPYTIAFQRAAPNSNSLLSSLDVLNYETSTALPEYVFEQVKKDYIFTVPYTTSRIIIKPTAQIQDYTDITVNGVDFPDDDPGKDYALEVGSDNTFTIVVTAQDGTSTTYNLYITRSDPDNEARLLNLVVNGADSMTPAMFVPSTYEYDFTIPKGTLTYTITPTAVSEFSVITIDDIIIPSGSSTAPYDAVDAYTTIYVYVSAQDGATTQVYTVNITNYNLIEQSDECDLLDVNFQGVDLAPDFKSNVYDYEIYTKYTTNLLQIEPTISKGASVEVSVGSKKLDEISNIYSTSFFTETDLITIKVTSASGESSKSYVFDVYKDTEGKQGAFKPITSEDIDFVSENPIIVDISDYALIDASVFNEMKDKYPDKTIVFTGNDYMLRIAGSDITENIPHTTQFDFGFSFTSPEESLIQAILDDSEYDEDAELEPIYLYFNDHTPLPGQMILTVVLGGSVGNETLYWNYYNTEYDRIDYYGYVQSNSKGTITVPLTHLSTYLVTTQEIGASEDRTNTGFGSLDKGNHNNDYLDGGIGTEGFGDDLTGGFGTGGSGTTGGDISGELTTSKPNPQTETDVLGFPIATTERGSYEQTTVYKWLEEKRNKGNKDKDKDLEEC